MRVLHFLPVYIPAWQYGGPILSVSRLCEGLVQKGVEVRVVTTNAGLPDFSPDHLRVPQDINGVQVFYYDSDHKSGCIRSTDLVESLVEHMRWADILHLSSIWQPLGIEVQKRAYVAGVPVIQTLRGALSPYSWSRSIHKKIPYFFFREKPFLQRAAAIHCTTRQEIKETKWLRLAPPYRLLANPLELSSLYTDKTIGRLWRLENNIPTDVSLFIVAGRLHHKKGLDLLPRALANAHDKRFHLLFIGDDDDGTGLMLRKSLDRLGLSNRCHWMRSIASRDLLRPLNAADWLLLPSRHENFGNIVIEALSCGCGVILSDRVGVNNMLDGCPGVLTGERRPRIWTKMIKKALMSERPGQPAERWVKTRFSMSVIADQALDIYWQILQDV